MARLRPGEDAWHEGGSRDDTDHHDPCEHSLDDPYPPVLPDLKNPSKGLSARTAIALNIPPRAVGAAPLPVFLTLLNRKAAGIPVIMPADDEHHRREEDLCR
jgi:hypothetical protein